MSELTVQDIVRTGLEFSTVSADVGGDDFANNGNTFLLVQNGGGASIDVTIASNFTNPPVGTVQDDVVVAVGAGVDAMIGPLPQTGFNDGDGQCNVTYSAVTTVTVAALSMGDTIQG